MDAAAPPGRGAPAARYDPRLVALPVNISTVFSGLATAVGIVWLLFLVIPATDLYFQQREQEAHRHILTAQGSRVEGHVPGIVQEF